MNSSPQSNRNVVLLTDECSALVQSNLRKVAEFLGLPVEEISAKPTAFESRIFQCVAVTASTLENLLANKPDGFHEQLLSRIENLFVFGFSATPEQNRMLSQLTAGSLTRATLVQKSEVRFSVPKSTSHLTKAFSGLSFESKASPTDVTFQANDAKTIEQFIQLEGQPSFLKANSGGTNIFLSGAQSIADLDETVRPYESLLSRFAGLVPAIIFFRSVFGARCWQGGPPRACFIIDDPLLRKKYGFVDYNLLQEQLRRHAASVSLAFIPWNAKRTDPAIAAMFRDSNEQLTLSVHGCDHTRGEFGHGNGTLLASSREALSRMALHEKLSAVPFDPVMVFPQGIFCADAMRALKASGFVAAANTMPHATDCAEVPLRDLLSPAMMTYDDFPLFLRRYPRNNIAEFAFDLFLGKPLLLVEHHDYFRNGYEPFSAFLAQVNELDPALVWKGLGTICRRVCLRRMEGGQTHVRFYTPEFIFQNDSGIKQAFTFYKREREAKNVRRVTVNGVEVKMAFAGEDLTFQVELAPQEQANIVVEFAPAKADEVYRQKLAQRVRIGVRRYLSEFRDNVWMKVR